MLIGEALHCSERASNLTESVLMFSIENLSSSDIFYMQECKKRKQQWKHQIGRKCKYLKLFSLKVITVDVNSQVNLKQKKVIRTHNLLFKTGTRETLSI